MNGAWPAEPERLRFQHSYRRPAILLALTLLTTSMAGGCHYLGFAQSIGGPEVVLSSPLELLSPWFLISGLWYALPMLIVLGAHEYGHYAFCRRYRVDASLPYFIPAPLPLTGTMGAVIRIKEAFPSKAALFDIGVAGPIAGFVMLLPFLIAGVWMSAPVQFTRTEDLVYFGEPLLFKAVAWMRFGALPEGTDITLHPMGFAAWFGMLATALNLLPFGQLDGGHIAYAVFGRNSRYVSMATLAATVALATQSSGWVSVTIMMVVMAYVIGLRHPQVIDEATPLDPRRQLVALAALVIFVISFTPVPIEFFVGQGP